MGALGSVSFRRRVKKLEWVFEVAAQNMVIDIILNDGAGGGLFGHMHILISRGEATINKPCTDEEELEIMRKSYEDDGHQLYGRGPEVSFADYLTNFCYLGPEGLAEARKALIEKLRGEASGA